MHPLLCAGRTLPSAVVAPLVAMRARRMMGTAPAAAAMRWARECGLTRTLPNTHHPILRAHCSVAAQPGAKPNTSPPKSCGTRACWPCARACWLASCGHTAWAARGNHQLAPASVAPALAGLDHPSFKCSQMTSLAPDALPPVSGEHCELHVRRQQGCVCGLMQPAAGNGLPPPQRRPACGSSSAECVHAGCSLVHANPSKGSGGAYRQQRSAPPDATK